MHTTIRQATVKDSAGLARVQVDSYRTAYAGILPAWYLDRFSYEEQEQDWHDILIQNREALLFVADNGSGEIIGYALGRSGPGEIEPYDGELVALHVRQDRQGRGTGSQLIAAVAGALQQAGCTSLMVWVLKENRAVSLYERLGGRLVGEKELDGDGEFSTPVKEIAYGWLDITQLQIAGP